MDDVNDVLQRIQQRLDHIEEYLVISGNRNGPHYTPFQGFTAPSAEVVALAKAGKRKEAIVQYRSETGADVTTAQAALDAL